MKNIANYLSISRAIMSIILAIIETFSFPFYIIWAVIIALIKMINVICSFIYYKKLVLLHTIANKITGLIYL